MIKLGIGLLGFAIVSVPVGYVLLKKSDQSNVSLSSESKLEDKEENKSENSSQTQNPEEIPNSQISTQDQIRSASEEPGVKSTSTNDLTEEQQKILDWSRSNGNCTIKITVGESGEQKEISELGADFSLEGLYNILETHQKGACKISMPHNGHREGNKDAIQGLIFKKKTDNSGWEEDMDDEILEEN